MRVRMLRAFDQFLVSTVQICVANPAVFTRNSHFGCVSQMTSAFGKDVRRPLTAGNACTMSPREPRRTTSNLGSVMPSPARGEQQFARGVLLRVADNRYTNSQSVRGSLFWHGVRSIVSAFRVYMREQFREQHFYVLFRKNYHVIHHAQRCHQQGSRPFFQDRTSRPLQHLDPGISVYSDE